MQPHSLYLHIPFCKHRCGYCDFNTYAGMDDLIPAYARAMQSEIRAFAEAAEERIPIHTIYFGGGTPSLMPVDNIAAILEAAFFAPCLKLWARSRTRPVRLLFSIAKKSKVCS